MNRKGFTLIELLAVLVALGLILGIGTFSISSVVEKTKYNSEEAFVQTIKDAMDIYIASDDAKELFNPEETGCKQITFEDVIKSKFKPIKADQLVNPANNKSCVPSGGVAGIQVIIYRNDNSSYYYKIAKNSLNGCFKYTISATASDSINYISNLEDPGNFVCS